MTDKNASKLSLRRQITILSGFTSSLIFLLLSTLSGLFARDNSCVYFVYIYIDYFLFISYAHTLSLSYSLYVPFLLTYGQTRL